MKEYRVKVMETPSAGKSYFLYEGNAQIETVNEDVPARIARLSEGEQVKITSNGKLESFVGKPGDWRIERSLSPEEMKQLIADIQKHRK